MCDGCSCHINPPCSHCTGECDCPKPNRELAESIVDAILSSLAGRIGDALEAVDTGSYDEIEESLTKIVEEMLPPS